MPKHFDLSMLESLGITVEKGNEIELLTYAIIDQANGVENVISKQILYSDLIENEKMFAFFIWGYDQCNNDQEQADDDLNGGEKL